jgi:hypothetical protein
VVVWNFVRAITNSFTAVRVVEPRIFGELVQSNGLEFFRLTSPDYAGRIIATTDWTNWTELYTNSPAPLEFWHEVSGPQRFYRLVPAR